MANLVKFATGTAVEYAALANKDSNTLYFITDEQRIYKGDTAFSGFSFIETSDLSQPGQLNTLYINSDDKSLWIFNGTNYVSLIEPKNLINKTIGTNAEQNIYIPNIKAVYDFVEAEISKVDAGGMNDTITKLEERIDAVENDKADAATTLSGYGITDAYTKTETDSAITTAIGKADHLKRAIVPVLPAIADANETTIYMVAIADGKDDQQYDEYMLINGAFEKIGSSAVDLTGYATEKYVDDKNTEITTAYKTADAATLKDAKDYADGLADNYATADQGALADSAIQSVIEGTTNGTISVDSTDVKVHGLGSAAYTESSAYDTAGSANTALSSAKAYTDSEIEKYFTWNVIE